MRGRAPFFAECLALAMISACSGLTNARRISAFRQVGSFHAPTIHSIYPADTHFVVAPESAMADRNVVLAYARHACADEYECFVLFWTSEVQAATSFPLSDREVGAMVANYNRNRGIGNDGLQCYNFGSPRERCRASGR